MSRSILITGCSSGIGYDAAHGLKREGWRVFATCRKDEDCARLRDEGLESFRLDYSDEASIRAGLDEALSRTGGTLDAIFNNGAFACPGAVEDLPTGALRELFETNLFGIHELTRLAIPHMRKQGHGRIVNCSSILGFIPARWRGAYVASKFAMEGLTSVLRIEMRDTPLKFVLIEPGPITSKIRENSIPQFERWIDWEHSARADQYRATLLKRLYEPKLKKDTFELPPSAVTRVLIRALDAKNPRARYRVTMPTHVMWGLRRLLPDSAVDWLCAKS